jgi:hypothetical protein
MVAGQAVSALASPGVRRGSGVGAVLPGSAGVLDVWCAAALPARCSRGDDPGACPEQHAETADTHVIASRSQAVHLGTDQVDLRCRDPHARA